jgi:hypothetical protein
MAKPPTLPPRRRQVIPAPPSRVKAPPKPHFGAHEAPTKPSRNANATRWVEMAAILPTLDPEGLRILSDVSAVLAPLQPPDLLLRYDALDERRKRVLDAVVHALAAPLEPR